MQIAKIPLPATNKTLLLDSPLATEQVQDMVKSLGSYQYPTLEDVLCLPNILETYFESLPDGEVFSTDTQQDKSVATAIFLNNIPNVHEEEFDQIIEELYKADIKVSHSKHGWVPVLDLGYTYFVAA